MNRIILIIILLAFYYAGLCQQKPFKLEGDPFSPTGAKWHYQSTDEGVYYDLEGILFKPEGEGPFPAVLISHGRGGNAYGYSTEVAREMVKWGYVCIATNYTHSKGVPAGEPGGNDASEFGAGDANILRAKKTLDILTSLDYVDPSKVAAFGHSMGAFVTTRLVAIYPDKFFAAGHTAGGVGLNRGRVGLDADAAGNISTTYIIHHGDNDKVVGIELAQNLVQILKENNVPHQFFSYPGYEHNTIRYDSLMFARTRDWFDSHLKKLQEQNSPELFYQGKPVNSAVGKARNPKSGLIFYAKGNYATDTIAVKNPYIIGALFQIIWSEVEKADGVYDWREVDKWITPWIKAGKKVALRVMWSTSGYWNYEYYKHPTPSWVWEKGGKYAYHEPSQTEIPLPWDPVYKKYALRFLDEVANRFDHNPDFLFIDVTPGAETNPYRFGTIRRNDPGFEKKYLATASSDGKTYSEELWLETVKTYVDETSKIFEKVPLLVTLNAGGMESHDRSPEIGWYCVNHGMFVGQNGLNKNSYVSDSPRRRAFATWDPHTKFFFEMVARSGAKNTGTLMEVMKAAERIHCSYLNVYPEDVLQGTKGSPDYDPAFEEALKYGASVIGRPVTIPSGTDELLGQKVFTYEQKTDLERLEALYHEAQQKKGRTGHFTDYFRAKTDGSVQPVGMYVPEDYSKDKKYPLILQLHGIGPKNIAGLRSHWKGMEFEHWIDPDLDVIYAQAYARQNASYKGMAEAELLQILEEIQGTYSVDPDRIYVMGHSMGGGGTINLALHYPDKFAAFVPIDAAIHATGVSGPDDEEWLSPQIQMQEPFNYVANAFNLPMYMHTAGGGLKDAQLRLYEQMKAEGCEQVHVQVHEGMPHHFAMHIPYHTFIPDMLKHTRDKNPERIKFKTNNLKYPGAYWMKIMALQNYSKFAEIDASKKEGEISITAVNVTALSVSKTSDENIKSVRINNTKLKWAGENNNVFLVNDNGKWRLETTYSADGTKSPEMPGLIKDAFESPFLVVYGDEQDFNLAHREMDVMRNPAGSRLVMVSDIPYKAARELTETDIQDYNLILFGTPESNSMIKQFQEGLPIQVSNSGVSQGSEFRQGASAVFIAPNPRNEKKYVVIWSGELLGKMDQLTKNTNSMGFHLHNLPDYVIFDNERVIKAGFY